MGALLQKQDFDFFRNELMLRSGVMLNESRSSLVQTRLLKRLLQHGFNNFAEYREWLMQSSDIEHEKEWQLIVNDLTTHTTEWFREIDHFIHLRDVLIPQWIKRKHKRPFRVWSAACSTGEEPYSMALVLNALANQYGFDYQIYSTDIDNSVLERASSGTYPSEGLDHIPPEYRTGAIALGTGAVEGWMKIRPHIREKIKFEQINLDATPYHHLDNEFDLTLCRNVLIYFQPETVERVVNAIYQVTAPKGYLYTGHSESLAKSRVQWTYVKPAVYIKGGLK